MPSICIEEADVVVAVVATVNLTTTLFALLYAINLIWFQNVTKHSQLMSWVVCWCAVPLAVVDDGERVNKYEWLSYKSWKLSRAFGDIKLYMQSVLKERCTSSKYRLQEIDGAHKLMMRVLCKISKVVAKGQMTFHPLFICLLNWTEPKWIPKDTRSLRTRTNRKE